MIFGNFRKQLVFRKHATAGIPVHNSQLADELVVFFGRRSPASWGNGDHGRIGKVKTFSNHENEMRWSPWSVPIKSFVGQLFDKRSWRLRLRLRGDQPSPPRDLFFFLFFFWIPNPDVYFSISSMGYCTCHVLTCDITLWWSQANMGTQLRVTWLWYLTDWPMPRKRPSLCRDGLQLSIDFGERSANRSIDTNDSDCPI